MAAGHYEYVTVQTTTVGVSVTLTGALTHDYTAGAQAIVVERYSTIDVQTGGTLTAPAWSDVTNTGGILAVEANGAVTIAGTIDMAGRGFRGADHEMTCENSVFGAPPRNEAPALCVYDNSYYGGSSLAASAPSGFTPGGIGAEGTGTGNGAGGGGGTRGQDCAAGGGGGNATAGAPGAAGGSPNGNCVSEGRYGGGVGGLAIVGGDLATSLVLGGAGGEGGADEDGAYPGRGGNAGGAILVRGAAVTISGAVDADGAGGGQGVNIFEGCGDGSGMGNGGGGAGGNIRISAVGTVTLGADLVHANGGAGSAGGECAAYPGGSGSTGKAQVAGATVTGTTSPTHD